jgi:hypothetical protein
MSDKTMPILRFLNGSQWASLYYYQGNFFYPVFLVTKDLERRINLKIAAWRKDASNEAILKADRAHPDYRNKVQLAEAQGL